MVHCMSIPCMMEISIDDSLKYNTSRLSQGDLLTSNRILKINYTSVVSLGSSNGRFGISPWNRNPTTVSGIGIGIECARIVPSLVVTYGTWLSYLVQVPRQVNLCTILNKNICRSQVIFFHSIHSKRDLKSGGTQIQPRRILVYGDRIHPGTVLNYQSTCTFIDNNLEQFKQKVILFVLKIKPNLAFDV